MLGHLPWTAARARRRAFAEEAARQYDIRPADPRARLDSLSGGNAQKVLVAREVEYAGDLLVAVGPTAGLDLAATAQVRQTLRRKADDGACVVVVSDDLEELAEVADRVWVVSRGRLVGTIARPSLSPEAIGRVLIESRTGSVSVQRPLGTGGALAQCAG